MVEKSVKEPFELPDPISPLHAASDCPSSALTKVIGVSANESHLKVYSTL